MQQFFSNSLHKHSWYEFSMLSFISWFVIALIAISTMSDKWIFSLSTTFLSQTILRIFRFSWSLALSFINLLMITFWLLVSIVMCILCVSTAKIWHTIRIEFAISFAHVWNLFRFARTSELTAWSVMSSLSSLQRDMIKSLWAVDMFVISWRICSINFFYIFFIFFIFIIFIMTFHLLRSDDNLSLRRCFLIVTSSLIMFAHDVILDEKCMLLCIFMLSCVCSCLLSSCTNVFSFCTFFAINAFWFSLFLSSESFWRCHISFTVTSFHEWSLLFSFFNINVCIRRSIMLTTYFLSLRELFDFTLLFLRDESTLLAIVSESALLQFMQFIVIYSSFRFILSWLYCFFQKFALHALWLFFDSSLYSIKKEVMNKMHAVIARIQNEHLIRAMIKQIVYHKVMQITVSKDWVSIFSFSQLTDFNKLIANQIEVILMNEKLNYMNWRWVESDLLCECISNMILKTDHVETVFSSLAILQFDFERRSRSLILSLQSRCSSVMLKNEDSHFMFIASDVVMISDLNSLMSVMQSLIIRFHQSCHDSSLVRLSLLALSGLFSLRHLN